MNFHLDKIECVFMLLNILMVHITSANISSSYKLKNIILPPYIGKLQDGLDSKILALRKVRRSFITNIFHRYGFIFVLKHKYQFQTDCTYVIRIKLKSYFKKAHKMQI